MTEARNTEVKTETRRPVSLLAPVRRGISLRKQLKPSKSFGIHRNRIPALVDEESKDDDMAAPLATVKPASTSQDQLDVRRNMELTLIQKFDSTTVNTGRGEYWCILSTRWMDAWIDFVAHKGPLPGPISNEADLFDKVQRHAKAANAATRVFERSAGAARAAVAQATQVAQVTQLAASAGALIPAAVPGRPDLSFKNGLRKVTDYRAVHPMIWYVLVGLHGKDSAPDVCRAVCDIYAADVPTPKKLQVASNVEPAAAHELIKYSTHYGVRLELGLDVKKIGQLPALPEKAALATSPARTTIAA